jgi:thiamine biosynthesis lipoprotein
VSRGAGGSALAEASVGGLARREGRALGSPLRLTIAGDDRLIDRAWAAVELTFAEVDRAMSRFRDDSEITDLCRRSPRPLASPSRTLVRALVAADRARRVTRGRFDPRVVEALERIGYHGAAINGDTVAADGPGTDAEGGGPSDASGPGGRILARDGRRGPVSIPVPIDLGGIGKGLALRWAADALDQLLGPTIDHGGGYLLDAGGDITGAGAPGPDGPWMVGIDDPAGGAAPLATVAIAQRGAIATSSIQRLHWQVGGRTVHHLIDPRTGEPGGAGLIAVSVAGPDAAWAEVWSKALFLEGAAGIGPAARGRGLAAWWVPEDGRLEMTPAARVRTTWIAAEAEAV